MSKDCLIIPRSHYRKFTNENGISQWLDITILAELNYLVSDGRLREDLNFVIVQNYFCDLYGSSKVCVRRALKRLQKRKLIYFREDAGLKILKEDEVLA